MDAEKGNANGGEAGEIERGLMRDAQDLKARRNWRFPDATLVPPQPGWSREGKRPDPQQRRHKNNANTARYADRAENIREGIYLQLCALGPFCRAQGLMRRSRRV